MGRASVADCLECRVIGTTVCVGTLFKRGQHRAPNDASLSSTLRVFFFPFIFSQQKHPTHHLASSPKGSSGAIAYELWNGVARPPAHRYVMAVFPGGFLAMGVYRAVM